MRLSLCLMFGLMIAFVAGEVFTAIFDFEDAVMVMTVTGSVIALGSVYIGLEWEKKDDWFD